MLLVVEHHWTWYRRNWRATAVSSILQPLLFLLAFGVGFGTLIDDTGRAAQATGGLDYLVWLAPALLCVSAVQTAVFDSTYPVLSGFKWQRHYLAMTATPIGPAQVVAGHLVWMTIKIAGCGAIYVAVIAAFGGVRSAGVGTALLVALLTGGRGGRPGHGLHRGRARRGLGVHRAVPAGADPDDAVLRHVLPDRPAAGMGAAGHVGVPAVARHRARPRRRRSAAGRHCRPSVTRRSSWRWSSAARRWPSRASGGGCTGDGAQPSTPRRAGRVAVQAPQPPPLPVLARLLPAGSYAGRSRALVRRSATAARRTWLAIVSGIFEPVFYLVAMGQGLGSLVGHAARAGRHADLVRRLHRARGCSPRRP